MDAPTPPAAPDPVATAKAQGEANVKSATNQYELGATNQNTPQGSLNYQQIGTWADGTPRFQATTSLNSGEQKIYDTGVQTRQNLGDIGQSQSAKIGALLNTPFDVNAARDSKIAGIQKTFLDPQWNQNYEAKKTELMNSGAAPGSQAYDTAMKNFSTDRQRAYDQSYLDSYNAGNQAALTERNQPINEITALMSGSQVQQPGFVNAPTPGVAPTDVIGAQQQALNQQNVGFNAQNQRYNGMMSGLFGLGTAGLTGGMSMMRPPSMGGWGA